MAKIVAHNKKRTIMKHEDDSIQYGEMKYSKADNSIFNFTAAEFIFCGCFVIIKKRCRVLLPQTCRKLIKSRRKL